MREADVTQAGRAVWLALLLAVPGCGSEEPLSPAESCDTLIDSLMACGAYEPGTYGPTEAEDRAGCVRTYEATSATCQRTLSSNARCIADSRCAFGRCSEYVPVLMECAP